jgi:replicative DNA helicase
VTATAIEPGRTVDVLAAERAVLGSALHSRTAAESLTELLPSAECFTDGTHQAVWEALRYLTENGRPSDVPSMLGRLVAVEQGVWRTGQAGVVLAALMEHATAAYEIHARTLLEAHSRRTAAVALARARDMIADLALPFSESAEMARDVIDAGLSSGPAAPAMVTAADLFTGAVERIEAGRPPGVVQFPWTDMRRLAGWMRPGQLITIAARPSLGKSLAGQDIARHVAFRQGLPVILFSLEMDRDEVMDRLLSAEAGVILQNIIESKLDDIEWQRIARVQERFAASTLVIDDTPQITLAHIRARLRGMARKSPAAVAIVDYLQLMKAGQRENRQGEVSEQVSGLKAIAREFRIPVVMLCQLNRGPETRSDKRPFISDARESGSVENDSDIAILIHRPDHYEPDSERAGEADLIVDKNRNGARSTVTVGFQGHFARFVDLSPELEELR